MFEFTFSICNDKINIIDFLYSKLCAQVKFNGGVIVKVGKDNRAKLTMAVPKKQRDYFVLLLLELVSEVITMEYKTEFIENNLPRFYADELMQTAFVSALAVFDKQTDKDIIKKALILEQELNLDWFYHFKLGVLQERWREICALIQENMAKLKASGGVDDLIKFLINTCDVNAVEAHIFEEQNKIFIADANKKPYNLFANKAMDNSEFALKSLITLSPAKIILHATTENALVRVIQKLYSNRVFTPENAGVVGKQFVR